MSEEDEQVFVPRGSVVGLFLKLKGPEAFNATYEKSPDHGWGYRLKTRDFDRIARTIEQAADTSGSSLLVGRI